MFRALLCPSSGARDYDVDYHIGRVVLDLRLGWNSVRVAACNPDTTYFFKKSKIYIKTFKTLLHVSNTRSSSGSIYCS